jgi:ubiquinone/menaquinone biosynthesis C-methylase UbiE
MFESLNGERLSYADNSFDRLIAIHVLEHIYQPHLALKEWVRDVGCLRPSLPAQLSP